METVVRFTLVAVRGLPLEIYYGPTGSGSDRSQPKRELEMNSEESMVWSDAWLLLASIYAGQGKPAPLEDVIAAADFIQHAIVTFEEVEGALARLTANGYLVFSERGLAPTEKTLVFYRSIPKPRRKILDEEEDLKRFIDARAWSPDQKPQHANDGASFPALTRAAFDAAVQAYLSRHPRLTGVKRKK